MSASIETSYQQLSPRQVAAFELQLGIALPKDYKQFLLRSNGGVPIPDTIWIAELNKKVQILTFFGLYLGSHHCLLKNLQRQASPKGMLPIAKAQGADSFSMSLLNTQYGAIYYGRRTATENKFYYVAKNINELLTNLSA